jgi:hypothetical protein
MIELTNNAKSCRFGTRPEIVRLRQRDMILESALLT